MYVYRFSINRYDTHTKYKQDAYEVAKNCRRERFFSSRQKALEYLDRLVERHIERRGESLYDTNGDKNFTNSHKYMASVIDSDNNLIEYGYHTITEFVVEKIDVD